MKEIIKKVSVLFSCLAIAGATVGCNNNNQQASDSIEVILVCPNCGFRTPVLSGGASMFPGLPGYFKKDKEIATCICGEVTFYQRPDGTYYYIHDGEEHNISPTL